MKTKLKSTRWSTISIAALIVSLLVMSGCDTNNKKYDVCVAGYYRCGDTSIACYWVNGVRNELVVPAGMSASGSSIAASGRNVYVSRGYFEGNKCAACQWVDGVHTDLAVPERGDSYCCQFRLNREISSTFYLSEIG